jgi:hypothetical protein
MFLGAINRRGGRDVPIGRATAIANAGFTVARRRLGAHRIGRVSRRGTHLRAARSVNAGGEKKERQPMVGVEPTTPALRKPCSAIELHRRPGPAAARTPWRIDTIACGIKRLRGVPARRCGKSPRGVWKMPKPCCATRPDSRWPIQKKRVAFWYIRCFDRGATRDRSRQPRGGPPSLRPEHPGRRSLLLAFSPHSAGGRRATVREPCAGTPPTGCIEAPAVARNGRVA